MSILSPFRLNQRLLLARTSDEDPENRDEHGDTRVLHASVGVVEAEVLGGVKKMEQYEATATMLAGFIRLLCQAIAPCRTS